MPYRAPVAVDADPVAPEPELPDVDPEPVVRRSDETAGACLWPPKSWLALVASVFVILGVIGYALMFATR